MKKIIYLIICLFVMGCTYNAADYPFVGKYYRATNSNSRLKEEYRLLCNKYKTLCLENATTGYVYPYNSYIIKGENIIAHDKESGSETLRIRYNSLNDRMTIVYGESPLYNDLEGLVFTRE